MKLVARTDVYIRHIAGGMDMFSNAVKWRWRVPTMGPWNWYRSSDWWSRGRGFYSHLCAVEYTPWASCSRTQL